MPVTPARPAGYDLPQHFADQMGAMLGPNFPTALGLAVSGGGDSMAMMHLAVGWARVFGISLRVATVDHGLRDESVAEAQLVADEAAALELPHETLRWTDWDGQGNLQDAARHARIDLLGQWIGSGHVLMAHTQDDQAETVMMRLLRGSGVDGLAGMAAQRSVNANWTVLRPLLNIPRAQLRHYAKVLHIPFVDDPSNDDTRFDRVRLRKLMQEADIDQATLTATAARMSRASEALRQRAYDVATQLLREDPRLIGTIVLDRDGFAQIEADTQLRILAAALQNVASAAYRPRAASLETALETVLAGGTATLGGGLMIAQGPHVVITREPKAVAEISAVIQGSGIWDTRWHLSGPAIQGLTARALGEDGLQDVPYEMRKGLPRAALASLPAIWDGDLLVACKPLRIGPTYDADLRGCPRNFPLSLLTH